MLFFNKICLYLSAFIPLYVLLFIKIVIEIINQNLSLNLLNSIMLILLALASFLGGFSLINIFSQKCNKKIEIISASNITENHFLNYFSLFVLFAVTFQIEFISMAVVFVIIIVMIGVVYVRNNLFYINPLLNILGFSFYEVKFKEENKSEIQKNIFLYYGKLKIGNENAFITNFNFNFIRNRKIEIISKNKGKVK